MQPLTNAATGDANTTTSAAARPGREALTFRIGTEEYGVDILRVREIRRFEAATSMPNSPAEMKGVINLRGTIVPILDLRLRFGRKQPSYDDATVTIILEVGETVVGWVVDSVSEVLAVADVRPPPAVEAGTSYACLNGIAIEGDRMIMLLDIDRVVRSWPVANVTELSQPPLAH